MNLTTIDKNFATANVEEQDVQWYEITQSPFSIHGVYFNPDENCFMRFPPQIAKSVAPVLEKIINNK